MLSAFGSSLALLGFILFFMGCQSGRGHFLVYLMKLELAALLLLGSIEDSYGFIMVCLALIVVEGAVGLSLIVALSRSVGGDRSSLGVLVSQAKWEKFQKKYL